MAQSMQEEAWIRGRVESRGSHFPGMADKSPTRIGKITLKIPLKGITAVASHPNCPLGVKGITKDPVRGRG